MVADFGAEHAFGKVNEKLKEHYGIELPSHAARTITLHHARQIEGLEAKDRANFPMINKPKAVIISETDGSMVPIVVISEEIGDKRKKKKVQYREARLTLAHEKGAVNPVFSATLGDPAETGRHINYCVHKVGMGDETKIHAVGDGAGWIANQIEEQFGKQGNYLIDFYHLCEYLAAAAPDCCDTGSEKEWMEEQKLLLKENQVDQVLKNVLRSVEPSFTQEVSTPMQDCYRYIQNRRHQLDYRSAIEEGLPIGSGEIESAHRYIIQSRIKIQGAWWREKNVGYMLTMRTKRANHEWGEYWAKVAA